MFPLYDINETKSKGHPVTLFLILINVLIFCYELSLFSDAAAIESFVRKYAMVNSHILENVTPSELFTLFSCMFLHSGMFHLLGNMWFLWIFGDNVEDEVGSITFLLFYLFAGISANIISVAADPNSTLRAVGASGAIAGVLGAYIVMHPEAKVVATHPIFGWLKPIKIHAYWFLGVWFGLQLISGWMGFFAPGQKGGVDWWAHIGGFMSGALFAMCVPRSGNSQSKTTIETPSLALQLFTLLFWSMVFSSILTWQVQLHNSRRPPLPSCAIVSAEIDPKLSQVFNQKHGFSGTNRCISIPVASGPTIWLFGNSWINLPGNKKLRGAAGQDSLTLVGNSAGWQSRNMTIPMQFFWSINQKKPAAILKSLSPGTRFEPISGAMIGGKLYLFGHDVQIKPSYKAEGIRLLYVSNPQQKPTMWKVSQISLPAAFYELGLGKACLIENGFLYVYGTVPDQRDGHNLVLARIHIRELSSANARWQFCGQVDKGTKTRTWTEDEKEAVILASHLPQEMTIQKIDQTFGYIATYLSVEDCQITLLQATKPEGPWSRPLKVYDCRKTAKSLTPFEACNHPSLSTHAGELVISYFGDIRQEKTRQIPTFVHVILTERLRGQAVNAPDLPTGYHI